MNIIHIAAECSPLAQVGGLGDVVAALTSGLARERHAVELFLPDYTALDRRSLDVSRHGPVESLEIGHRVFAYSIVEARQADSEVGYRLVSCPELFDLPGVYSGDADEPWRYALLCEVALQAALGGEHRVDIVHCHDWHGALAAARLRSTMAAVDRPTGPRSVLTLHNLAYQGVFSADLGRQMGLDELVSADRINFLEAGIRAADLLTTVSPGYARQIQTAEHGMGLEALLSERREHLFGVLNGVDEREWDPEHDERLAATYSVDDLEGKRVNRRALLERAGLTVAPGTPILSVVSRLVEQKGCDLFRDGFGELLERRDAVLVVLGTGDRAYEEMFAALRETWPAQVAFFREFNADLAHLIEAGSDIFLMPSRFEPCGLNQMYSMLYGTVPVVHHTGGLADTVQPFDADSGNGTGLVFYEYSPTAFHAAVESAIDLFSEPALWQRLIRNGMTEDFSWSGAVARYLDLYRACAESAP